MKKSNENECIKLIKSRIKTNWSIGGRSTGYIERRKTYEYCKQMCEQHGVDGKRFEEIWNITLKSETYSSME